MKVLLLDLECIFQSIVHVHMHFVSFIVWIQHASRTLETQTYYSKESEEDDNSKGEECYECIGVDIRVSILKYLHQKKASNDEHEGSI